MKRIVTIFCLLALIFAGGGLSRLAKVEVTPKAKVVMTIAADTQLEAETVSEIVPETVKEHCCDKQKLMETSCSGPLALLASGMGALLQPQSYRPKPVASRLCVDLTNSGMKRPPRLHV
ncbi:MAG: hypothetical protein AAFQ10_03615 [Pseudomonadota bacterium]